MKKIYFILLISISISIFGENKVSIETKGNELLATITINDNEYIELNDDFLYLTVESNEYNFIFAGYPDGIVGEDGSIHYTKSLTLKGKLVLKSGVPKGKYTVFSYSFL